MDRKNLPKWAQEQIRTLERERDNAVAVLNKWQDSQTPSSIWTDEALCIGEGKGPSFKKRYIQGYKAEFLHAGVHLSILLRDTCIDVSWSAPNHGMDEIALVPESYQKCRLVSRDNMRTRNRKEVKDDRTHTAI